MTISGVGLRSNLLVASLSDTRDRLDDLQRQLGTGQLSTTYAGLGADRGLAVSLRNQINLIAGYADAVKNVGVRINVASSALTDISHVSSTVKAAANTSTFTIDNTGQTVSQRSAVSQLDQVLTLLNSQAGDRYLFSGRATNKPATQDLDLILNGDVTHAGFKQVLSERQQADLGSNGLGRLAFSAASATPAALTGSGATLTADAVATMTGSQNLGAPYTSAGGTLTINGVNVAISPGDNVAAILAKINAPAVVSLTGVSATAPGPGNNLTLTQADDDTPINLTGTTASLLTEFGVGVGPAQPNTLLTQVPAPVTAGQTLTVKVGTNPTLTITFGTNESAVPPEVSTLAELNAALGTLAGGTASVDPTGNITITAGNTSDALVVGGNANPAKFGLASTTAVPSNIVGLAEETPVTVFGFKLASLSTTSAGIAVTGPTSPAPALVSMNFQTQPLANDQVKLAFNLPDGSSDSITLTATTQTPPGLNQFTIGTSLAQTTANFQAALNTAVSKLAATSLTAASAIAASNNFFDVDAGQPPMRVAGPPFATATALTAGTAANTVTWYTGEMGTDPARGTAVAQVDNSLTVAYGARANEQALTNVVKNIAVYAAMTYSSTDPNAQARYYAVNQRVGANLASVNGQQQISDISAELAFAQATMTNAQQSEAQRNVTLTNFLQGIEQADPSKVSAEILALQTQMQASLQTTAMLYKLSIVNFIS